MKKALILLVAAFVTFATSPGRADNADIRPPAESSVLVPGPLIGDISYACDESPSKRCTISQFMRYARVCALLVIKSGSIRLLNFNNEGDLCKGDDSHPNNWSKRYGIASVTKSITSALLGHAIATRYGSVTKAEFEAVVKRPVGELAGNPSLGMSAYDGVPLERILGMRSGVRWSEYGWFADSNKFKRYVRDDWKGTGHPKESVSDFVKRYQLKSVSGYSRPFNYSALDAAVSAAVAQGMVSGLLTDFLQNGIWAGIGAEASASWGVDKTGLGIGPCCFRATVRDFGRFGVFVLNKGRDSLGRQLIPSAWFELATGHGFPGADAIPKGNASYNRGCPLDYRYFWWLFPSRTDFTAVGRSGQFVHIYPDKDVVIVQISDWGIWKDGDYLECETFKAHDALVRATD